MHVPFRKAFPLIPKHMTPEHIPDEQIGKYTQEKGARGYLHTGLLSQDCEAGFVMSDRGNAVFCRYWSKTEPDLLRTTSCSELTPKERLLVVNTYPQRDVDKMIEQIEREGDI